MNYFDLHIGDYDRATAHLTACEDGIYGRLIRRYMATERPLPLDVSMVQRLVRARTRYEKQAVIDMLAEFFHQDADGHRYRWCDEGIAAFYDKKSKAKASADARWANRETHSERTAKPMRTHSERNADASRTQCETDATVMLPVVKQEQELTASETLRVPALVAPRLELVPSKKPDPDPKRALFNRGVVVLAAAGSPESKARSLIGKLLKFGIEFAAEQVETIAAQGVIDPAPWINRVCALEEKRIADAADPLAWLNSGLIK